MEYASCKDISVSQSARLIAENCKDDNYQFFFPINDTLHVDGTGKPNRNEMCNFALRELELTWPKGADQAKKDRIVGFIKDFWHEGIDFISADHSQILFWNVDFDFAKSGIEKSVKAILEWVDEANVPDLLFVDDLTGINIPSEIAALSRLQPEMSLPYSKKKLRWMIKSGFDFQEFIKNLEVKSSQNSTVAR